MKHPNTAASANALLAAGWLVTLVAHFGFHLSTVTALTIVGLAGTARLYIGRRGIIGAFREAETSVLWGSDGVAAGHPPITINVSGFIGDEKALADHVSKALIKAAKLAPVTAKP